MEMLASNSNTFVTTGGSFSTRITTLSARRFWEGMTANIQKPKTTGADSVTEPHYHLYVFNRTEILRTNL